MLLLVLGRRQSCLISAQTNYLTLKLDANTVFWYDTKFSLSSCFVLQDTSGDVT